MTINIDTSLYSNKYLSIKECSTHKYYYAERLGTDSVAFILYDQNKGYGLIKEFKPPIDQFVITAFGGSIDKDKTPVEIVIDEVKEEAGYIVNETHIKQCGKRFVSTQMNQWCYLFLVDVTGLELGEREPQTHLESIANVVWMPYYNIMQDDFEDWKAQAILITRI